MEAITCPICKQKNYELVINSSRLRIYRCKSCDLHFVNSKEGMIEKDYYKNFSISDYISYYEDFRLRYFGKNWKLIKKLKTSGRALDFGASFGWFLESAPKSWEVTGLEPSKKAVSYAKSKGIKVFPGDQKQLKGVKSFYDLITLWNVLEHMSQPVELLKTFNMSLKPGGLLIISVPDRSGLISNFSYLSAKFKFYKPISILFQVGNPSPHLFHYSEKNLRDLLSKTGFTLLSVHKQPIIDIKNIDKRISLEKKSNLPKSLITKIGVISTYYLSSLLNKHDEIVVYAKKN